MQRRLLSRGDGRAAAVLALPADQSFLLHLHSGNGDMGDLGRRFLECFIAAADDAGLPGDPRFRAALRASMTWAVDDVRAYSVEGSRVPDGVPMPRWAWDGPDASIDPRR